jgi:hypothetical protein
MKRRIAQLNWYLSTRHPKPETRNPKFGHEAPGRAARLVSVNPRTPNPKTLDPNPTTLTWNLACVYALACNKKSTLHSKCVATPPHPPHTINRLVPYPTVHVVWGVGLTISLLFTCATRYVRSGVGPRYLHRARAGTASWRRGRA